MEANPESPVYVRLGIALCAFQLRGYKVAKAAFQGVLDMVRKHVFVFFRIY